MKKMLSIGLLVCLFSVFIAGGQAVLVPAQDEFPVDPVDQGEYAIYARIDGVDGECNELNHKDWIVIDSMMFGVHVPEGGATGQSRRRASVIVEDIELVKEIDKSSPKIAEAVCEGKTFDSIEIEVCASTSDSGRVFVRYELKKVMFKSYWHMDDIRDGGSFLDTFTLSYEGITMTYTEYDEQGNDKGDTEWTYVNQE